MLSELELHVLEAIDNESMSLSREERELGHAALQAYRNAGCYADQWGHTVEEFRSTIRAMGYEFTKAELD